MKAVKPLPFPQLSWKRWIAVSVVAFGVFSGGAGILLSGLDDKNRPDVWLVLAVVAFGSIVVGASPYVYEVALTAWTRMAKYNTTANTLSAREATISDVADFLRQLNTDLPIQEIRDDGGTVHLVFGYGTTAGLGDGSLIEVVRQAGGQSLGTVQVVRASDDWSLARPLNRAVPEFWEGLEDRMRSDFSPPAAVVGRVFRITGSTVVDVLYRLEAHDKQGATNGG